MLVQVVNLTENEATIVDYNDNQIVVPVTREDHDGIQEILNRYEECVFEYDPATQQFVSPTLEEGELLMNPDDYIDINRE